MFQPLTRICIKSRLYMMIPQELNITYLVISDGFSNCLIPFQTNIHWDLWETYNIFYGSLSLAHNRPWCTLLLLREMGIFVMKCLRTKCKKSQSEINLQKGTFYSDLNENKIFHSSTSFSCNLYLKDLAKVQFFFVILFLHLMPHP